MLSAVILSTLSYPAFTVGTITGTPAVCPSRSSRTREGFFQYSNAYTGYGPNCLTTFWTQLTYRFHGRTAQPLGRATAPGCDEPTSRCQTFPSIWTLGENQPVIPRVTFIRWVTTLPLNIARSLRPTFVSVRLVGLTVKLPYVFALYNRFLTGLRKPLYTSVSFWEVTAPVKLPTRNCLLTGFRYKVRCLVLSGWYLTND